VTTWVTTWAMMWVTAIAGLRMDNGGVDGGQRKRDDDVLCGWGISATGIVDKEVMPLPDSSYYFHHGVNCKYCRNC
jgi:hypothetical protein